MGHTCHARGCDVEVVPEKLMCRAHWAMVPKGIQRDVRKHYRAGQCDDKRPSASWHQAADVAIGWVSLKTGEKLRKNEVRALVSAGFRQAVIREYVRRGAALFTVERAIKAIMEAS